MVRSILDTATKPLDVSLQQLDLQLKDHFLLDAIVLQYVGEISQEFLHLIATIE